LGTALITRCRGGTALHLGGEIGTYGGLADIAFNQLVDITKLRWRIERDYHELKQEVGLGHFEGRGWRGFHHHATLCIAAYGFLVSERETIPPSETGSTRLFEKL
jgi:SRSO17 transposase